MEYFLGIDGGGSHTRALLRDATGMPVNQTGTGLSGPTNPRFIPLTDIRAHLLEAIQQASVGVETTAIRAVHLGIAGCGDSTAQATLAKIARECMDAIGADQARITVGHDLEIVLAGNLSDEPGILIVAGTGSACCGHDAQGRTVQCGGWGDLVDDVGSGSWIGLQALQVAVRQADGRHNETPLMHKIMESLGIESMEAFKARIHPKGLSRGERAALAPTIIKLAASGDSAAALILTEAIQELCLLAETTSRQLRLSAPRILLAGGLIDDPSFYEAMVQELTTRISGALPMRPQASSVAGAIVLALRNAGIAVSKDTMQTLKKHL